jgi:hypothetical protein
MRENDSILTSYTRYARLEDASQLARPRAPQWCGIKCTARGGLRRSAGASRRSARQKGRGREQEPWQRLLFSCTGRYRNPDHDRVLLLGRRWNRLVRNLCTNRQRRSTAASPQCSIRPRVDALTLCRPASTNRVVGKFNGSFAEPALAQTADSGLGGTTAVLFNYLGPVVKSVFPPNETYRRKSEI